MDIKNLRFDLSNPWARVPEDASVLIGLIMAHKEIQEECGDHSVSACECGANRFVRIPDHLFDWERHFGELWNAALDEIGL